ncbi:MAG: DUF2281 domain-containing protein [Gemmatimonadales bacterium]|nr:DUF2281 domain-containing protein [Gemmatimonadales bacterium]MYH09182.1 DUF2281 domain-containing protein [Gemmatimonadales bacterium]
MLAAADGGTPRAAARAAYLKPAPCRAEYEGDRRRNAGRVRTTTESEGAMAEEGMNEILRKKIWRKLQALPEDKQYEVVDFIDYLASKYASRPAAGADPFQHFAESVHRGLRRTRASTTAVKGTMKVLGAADRVIDSFREAGRGFLAELEAGSPEPEPREDRPPPETREIVVDP